LLYLRIDQEMSWKGVAQVLAADGRVREEQALRKRFERIKERLRRIAKQEGLLGT
jgi:RNA polymerase sigma-70 factor (ECF subfamily)